MSKNKISYFFKKVNSESDEKNEKSNESSSANIQSDGNECNLPKKKQKTIDVPNDILKYCRRKLSDDEKYEVLTKLWMPDEHFKFPQYGVRNLKVQLTWLRSFTWLVYSPEEDGIYCKYCVSFGADSVGKGSHEKAHAFVQKPFTNWKKALDKIKEHGNTTYHQNAVVDGQNFKLSFENKKNNIICEIDHGRKHTIMENRKKLEPIVRAVLLCGRQGLALRGHRDDGPLLMNLPEGNDGNFRALLSFAVASGDAALKNHLMTAAHNQTYISKTMQNEIIEATKEIITSELVQRINESKCFSVVADETTDISGIEQFSICARYVRGLSTNFEIREDFICFVPVYDVIGSGLANTLLNTLKDLGLNLNFLAGQGYDGARSMSGDIKGCAAIIQKSYPNAYYVHCANHNLNLAITHACKIPPIRNCLDTMKEVVNLFRQSTKAGLVLKEKIEESCPSAKQTRLLKFCETRWVEHLSSLSLFYEVYEPICIALQELSDKNIVTDGLKPHNLLCSIETSKFIVSLTIMKPLFALTKNVSLQLQDKNCDLSCCLDFCKGVNEELEGMRRNAENEFKNIFKLSQEIAHKTGVTLEVPRRVGRQINRDNYLGEPEDYYRCSIYIPFLDNFLYQISTRFLKHANLLQKIQTILPYKAITLEADNVQETVKTLEKYWPNDFTHSDEIVAELTMWRREKALAATGNRGVQIASDWLLAHVNDSTLDETSPREYILYACPTGPFLQQLEEFWNKSRMVCGWNGAHNYVPHITLVSFFKAPDDGSLQLSKALKLVVDMSGALLDRPLKLEPYMSQNFMGFFVAEEDANYLKRLSLQYVKEVSNSTISLEPHVKSLHLTLAYQFPQNQFNALKTLVESLDASCASCWELRLYSRDPRLATKQVHKVVYPHSPHEIDELELRIGDYIYLSTDAVDSSCDGWAEGISWLTGSSGHLPVNYTERTAESDAWTLHRVVQLSKSMTPSLTSAEEIDIVDGRSVSIEHDEQHRGLHHQIGLPHELIEGTSFNEDSENSVEKYLRKTLQPCLDLPLGQGFSDQNTAQNRSRPLSQQSSQQTVQQCSKQPDMQSFEMSSPHALEVAKRGGDMEIMVEPIGVAAPRADDTLSMDSERSHEAVSFEAAPAKSRRIYIMRHGERVDFTFGTWIPYCFDEFSNYVRKDLNMPKKLPRRQRCPEGWQNDSPLTNIGLYQAKLTGEALLESNVCIDHVYCSPAYRCVQTCISTLEGLHLRQKFKVKLEPGLFEWMAWYPDGVPDWLSKSELLEGDYNVDTNYQPFMSGNMLNDCIKETTEEFYTRNYEIMRKIIETTKGNILVVAHATTLDTCTRQLIGASPRSTNELRQVIHKIPYCSLGTVEEVDAGVWKLVEPECLPVTHSKNPRFEWNALTAT